MHFPSKRDQVRVGRLWIYVQFIYSYYLLMKEMQIDDCDEDTIMYALNWQLCYDKFMY